MGGWWEVGGCVYAESDILAVIWTCFSLLKFENFD